MFSRPSQAPVEMFREKEKQLRNTELPHVLEVRSRPTGQNFLSSNQGKMGVSQQ